MTVTDCQRSDDCRGVSEVVRAVVNDVLVLVVNEVMREVVNKPRGYHRLAMSTYPRYLSCRYDTILTVQYVMSTVWDSSKEARGSLMTANPVVLAVAIVYLLLMIAMGIWANSKMKSSRDFLVAGQSLGFFVMAIATFSSIQSGWGMVGATGTTSAWGLGAFISTQMIAPAGFAAAWFLLGIRLRRIAQRYDVYSIPDIIRVRYKSRLAHGLMSLAMAIGTIGYMTAQIVAAGIITSMLLGIPLQMATWIGAIVVAVYTFAGGMIAAIWTDLVQGLLMIVVSIVVFFVAVGASGGWMETVNTLTEAGGFLDLDSNPPAVWVMANAFMIMVGVVAQPQLVHKFLMLKSSKELKWGASVAGIAYAITSLFVLGVGLASRATMEQGLMVDPGSLDLIVTEFLGAFAHPIIVGVALTALLAAIMSSASSFITIGASALTRDLAGALRSSMPQGLLAQRLASLLIVAAAVTVGLYLPQIIYLLGAIGWAAFGAAVVGPIVLGIYWRRGTGVATSLSIFVGLALNLILAVATAQGWFEPPAHFLSGAFVMMIGIIVYVVTSFLTKSPEDKHRFDRLYFGAPAVLTAVDPKSPVNCESAGGTHVQ